MILANAGCHYVMGLPQGDDVMLMYQSTGFHDIAAAREILKKEPIKEFADWLSRYDIWVDGHPGKNFGNPTIFVS